MAVTTKSPTMYSMISWDYMGRRILGKITLPAGMIGDTQRALRIVTVLVNFSCQLDTAQRNLREGQLGDFPLQTGLWYMCDKLSSLLIDVRGLNPLWALPYLGR